MINKAVLLFHTLRYLKLRQILGRLQFRWRRVRVDLSPPPELSAGSGKCVNFAQRRPSMTGPSQFIFLNKPGKLNTADDWNDPSQGKLWLYNLHYFDDLNALGADKRRQWHRGLINRWISENPIGRGNGWEPYPSSLRIVNWIKWTLSSNGLTIEQNYSLAVQVRYLSQQLEYHLLGNHLFANAKALVFAGFYFHGDEADAWLKTGLDILDREISEQILADGAQFELTPMYHCLALEDILDLLNVFATFEERVPRFGKELMLTLKSVAPLMLDWMQAMSHPDGQFSFFNDSAFGIAPAPSELETYAGRLGISAKGSTNGCTQLNESGYLRIQKKNMVAILDVAQIGPDYLPGHAHADTLSFEMSGFGQRILVNSGTSCYGTGPERQRQRSTATHNTVTINGEDSSEIWSGFRVARRARPFARKVSELGEEIEVSCSHNGYKRLRGKPIHHRCWQFKTETLTVSDRISGHFDNAVARYHFHPDIVLMSTDGYKSGVIILEEERELHWIVLAGEAEIETSSYHSEFGISQENQCLVVKFETDCVSVRFNGLG